MPLNFILKVATKMGVRGLETFIEKKCTAGFYEVRIEDLAKSHKQKTATKPVIVVDGSSCLRHIYGKGDWLFGGQYQYFTAKLKTFVNFFSSMGVDLVFIFDGFTVERKRAKWCERREKAVKDIETVFRLLSEGTPVESIPDDLVQFPPELNMSGRIFLKSCKQCSFITSVEECDDEIVKYATVNQCLAILGQDTDYIIYKSAPYYLSMKHLNLEKGTTYAYDRSQLANQLGIPLQALPLFASLAGNDLISRQQLVQFHRRLPRNCELFYNVARYITKHCQTPLDFDTIAKDVFGDISKTKLLETSVKSYLPLVNERVDMVGSSEQVHWNEIVKKTIELMKTGDVSFNIYGVIVFRKFELSASLENRNYTSFPPIAELYLLLRKRIYGILLHEHQRSSGHQESVVELCCCHTLQPAVQPISIQADQVPRQLHPGLMVLWTSQDPSMEERRWKILIWGVTGGKDFPLERLRSLPPRYQVVVLICHYLLRNYHIRLNLPEIASLLIQAINLQQSSPESLIQIRIRNPSLTAISMATVFLSGALHLLFLNQAAGSPIPYEEFNPACYFDGPLFHKVYQESVYETRFRRLLHTTQDAVDLFDKMKSLVYWKIKLGWP